MKSIVAVLAGFVLVVALSVGTDSVLEKLGVFPSFQEQYEHGLFTTWILLVALAYRCRYAVAGGYLTAALAPNRPMRHAMILGVIGTIVGILGTIANWNKSPAWYPIMLVVLSFLCVWFGAKLKTRQASSPG